MSGAIELCKNKAAKNLMEEITMPDSDGTDRTFKVMDAMRILEAIRPCGSHRDAQTENKICA